MKMSEQEYNMAVAANEMLKDLELYKSAVEENLRLCIKWKKKESGVINQLQIDIETAFCVAENTIKEHIKKCC
jgi:hypothetical protein